MSAINLIDLADPGTADSAALADARRAMEVCNACRYCEGYCAVFPAMELHREFANGTLNYLANLCHSCQGCFSACQYAPPHEFGINVPKSFAELRNESYAQYAWPQPLGAAFRRNGLMMALSTAVGITGALLLLFLLRDIGIAFGIHPVVPGQGFYRVVPEAIMITIATATFLFSLLAMGMGFLNFWRDAGVGKSGVSLRSILVSFRDAATLRYLGGSNHGCDESDQSSSARRRYLHHAMAYGFLLCFAATSVGAFYDNILGCRAPYPFLSLPVLLGTIGGIGLTVGTAGLLWEKLAGDQEPRARDLLGADAGLLILLFLIAVSGLMLLGLRGTSALGVALTIHLGVVLAFFVTMPYSKFVHSLYRTGALIRHAVEHPKI